MKLIVLLVTALALTSCNWKQTQRGGSDEEQKSLYTIVNEYEGQALYLKSGDQETELVKETGDTAVQCVQLEKKHFNDLRVQYASASTFWKIATFDWIDGGAEVLCSNAEGDEDYQNCPKAGSFKYIKGSKNLIASEAIMSGCKTFGQEENKEAAAK